MREEKALTVSELVEKVIPYIEAKQYNKDYVKSFRQIFNRLVSYCTKHEEICFSTELAQQFLQECYHQKTGTVEKRCSRAQRAMDLLSDYQHFGTVMVRRRLNRSFPQGFDAVSEGYLKQLELKGRKENTILCHRKFLYRLTDFLDSLGIAGFKYLTSETVNQFIKLVLCNYSNDVAISYFGILKRFLQYLALSGNTEEDLSLKLIPVKRTSSSARLPATLTLEQIEQIVSTVDRESPQGKRDYAVLMIAIKLGIRTCDIRNLRPSNIDWEQHTVSFTQIKTGEPLTLPLPIDVGWAIIDYLKNGRPVSDNPQIFLRAVAPYTPLNNLDNILIKHMRKAGIPLDSLQHHGLHALRHSLATHMLDEEIPITSIQGVLGHVNATSTEKYIGVNVRQLRSCALEVIN